MGVAGARGRAGESLAAAYLELRGFRLVDHNLRLAGVEIDLLAREGDTQVLVEVKLRSRTDYGAATEAVDRVKRMRLLRAARALEQGGADRVRVDVVAVELCPDGALVKHYRNAVLDSGGIGP
jgi:putative endonuclease